jgi:hypothetical protein
VKLSAAASSGSAADSDEMTGPIGSRRRHIRWMSIAEGIRTVRKKLIVAGVFAVGLAASVSSSPAMAACAKRCWQVCSYQVAGRCYVWANRCEPVCSLPAWKYDKNSPKSGGGKWVPNSPAKGKGVPTVPAGGTWNPSRSAGGKAQSLRSGGRR